MLQLTNLQAYLRKFPTSTMPQRSMTTFNQHFMALKQQIIIALIIISILFIGFACYAQPLYYKLAMPLLQQLPHNGHMIATSIIAPILTPLKFAFYLSIFAGLPIIAIQTWFFISPGLNKNERKQSLYVTLSAIILFFTGMAFAYYCVFPSAFYCFALATPNHVVLMPDIQLYLAFALQAMLAFGMVFQIPLVITTLIANQIITAKSCRAQRSIVIVASLVIGMLITPPDVISQIMIAIPMCLLFEIGLIIGERFHKRNLENSRNCGSIPTKERKNGN